MVKLVPAIIEAKGKGKKKIRTGLALALLALLVGCGDNKLPGNYKLPDAANMIEEQQSACDMHGDFSYCAKFTLSEADMKSLRKQGFAWFPQIKEGHVSKAGWATGALPENVAHLVNGLDIHLKSAPKSSTQYSYLYEWVDGGFWRLITIDDTEKVVYYYRVSW